MPTGEEPYGFADSLWIARGIVPENRLVVALKGSQFCLQLGLVAGDVVDDFMGDIVAVDGWVHSRLLAGGKHGDFKPDPAFYVHDAGTGSVSKMRILVGGAHHTYLGTGAG